MLLFAINFVYSYIRAKKFNVTFAYFLTKFFDNVINFKIFLEYTFLDFVNI